MPQEAITATPDDLIRKVEPSPETSSPEALPIPGSRAKLESLGIESLDELEDFEPSEGPNSSPISVDPDLFQPVDDTSSQLQHVPEEVPRDQRRRTLPTPQPPSLEEIESAYDTEEAERSANASFGKPTVKIAVETGVTYDDNIFISADSKESDTIVSTSVRTAIEAGNFNSAYGSRVQVAYQPQAYVFVDHSGENSIDHDAEFEVHYTPSRFTVGARGSYRKTSGGNPDFGERVDAQVGNVELMMAYAFTAKTRAEITGAYTDRRYDGTDQAFDSREASGQFYVDYEASSKSHIAAGVEAGQLDVDDAGTQDFQRALLRLRSQATDKTRFTAEGGADFRQTEGGDTTTPVVELALQHTPREGTDVGVRLTREIQPSGSLGGQNFVRTGAGITGSQRLTDRFKFTLDAGYDRYSYESAASDTTSDRDDDFYYIRPGLRYQREHVNADLFYEYRENSSSDSFSYDVNRVGISLGAEF